MSQASQPQMLDTVGVEIAQQVLIAKRDLQKRSVILPKRGRKKKVGGGIRNQVDPQANQTPGGKQKVTVLLSQHIVSTQEKK